jgi:hypothetical protein
MPRNGSGTYSLPAGNPVVSQTPIRSVWGNTTLSDIATALTQSIARDGQTAPTGNLPMAAFRHQNVGAAAALTDYARTDQVQNGSLLRCTAEAMPTVDGYTANLPFGSTTFASGQQIVLVFPSTNTTVAPTLNINNSAAFPILRENGSSVQVGDCLTGVPSRLVWNATSWLLLGTAAGGGGSGVTSFNSRFGAVTLLSSDIVGALGYTPASKGGDVFTGPITLSGDATTALQPVTLQQMLATIAGLPTVTGVNSFNTRTGTVTLTGSDVTTALGFSPVQSFNSRTGAVTLMSADVTTALGYSPVQSFNSRTGTVTLLSADVTGALGYTPVNKAGDTISGALTVTGLTTLSAEREGKTALGNLTGSQALNWALGGSFTATVTGSGATFTQSSLPSGVVGYIVLDLTNGGVATSISTLLPGVKWPGGAGLYSLSSSGRDLITLMCHDGSTVNVVGFAKAMS